jgi:hypothetical protein
MCITHKENGNDKRSDLMQKHSMKLNQIIEIWEKYIEDIFFLNTLGNIQVAQEMTQ